MPIGTRTLLAPLAAAVLLAASPPPSPAPAPTLSVVCRHAPLYVFQTSTDRPVRAHAPDVTQGQRFALVSGPRTTLQSFQYYETDIVVVEPGYAPNAHYWISRDCAIPG